MTNLEPLPADEWFIENPDFRSFVATVQEISNKPNHRSRTLHEIEPYFSQLLSQQK